jgi:hypothetical protein
MARLRAVHGPGAGGGGPYFGDDQLTVATLRHSPWTRTRKPRTPAGGPGTEPRRPT